MKAGQVVHYCDAHGAVSQAVVTAVVGAGPSGAKRLDLSVGGERVIGSFRSVGGEDVSDVAHIADAVSGEAAWSLEPIDVTQHEEAHEAEPDVE